MCHIIAKTHKTFGKISFCMVVKCFSDISVKSHPYVLRIDFLSSVRYVESFFVPLTSVEQDLQTNLVSLNLSQSEIVRLQNAVTHR